MSDWYSRANCADTQAPCFFPTEARLAPIYLRIARAHYCDLCLVKTECLAEAVQSNAEGIWAGTTTEMRRAMRRRAVRKR